MLKFVMVTLPVLLGLMWIATNMPRLGIVLGAVLVLSPLWLMMLGAFSIGSSGSDGSAAGLVIGLLLLGLMGFLVYIGIAVIRTARDNL